MFVFPNIYIQIPFSVMVFEGGAFWKGLGHEGEISVNGISVFLRVCGQLPHPFCQVKAQEKKLPIMNQEAESHQSWNLLAS